MSALSEFDIIRVYFQKNTVKRGDVVLGIGDDAALLQCAPDQLLVAATDTLIENVHFPKETRAEDIAYKALAVNLSDLAAMGAEPLWFLLALTLPTADARWLEAFSQGLFELARPYDLQLAGGDTTRGPLSITIQVLGRVPSQQALLRSGAQSGDKIYVSGTLGDAGLGLKLCQRGIKLPEEAGQFFLERLHRPQPQIQLGLLLRGGANSAIDLSDGLVADLGHLLTSSQVGARIEVNQLPLSPHLKAALPLEEAQGLALHAGDDYELCFTVPEKEETRLLRQIHAAGFSCTAIGEIRETQGLELVGYSRPLVQAGYRHFP
jgi:thiamine-monophosphate kinase